MNPNSLKNLEPMKWKPGVSANPGGRPKKDAASEIMAAVIENNAVAIYNAVVKRLVRTGDANQLEILAQRPYGRVVQKVKVDGNIDLNSLGRAAALLERAAERAAQVSRSK